MGSFSEMAWSFAIQTLSGVVAVFVGIWLALIVERRRRAEDAREQDAQLMREFDRAMDTILGCVVKNTAEAKRIIRLLGNPARPSLIHAELETAAWYASHNQFIALCRNVDQRVIFSQFFDNVRRLQAFVDFRCSVHVAATTAVRELDDPALHALLAATDKQLAALAEDLRFCGVLLVNDHGKPVHKRLMGMGAQTAAANKRD